MEVAKACRMEHVRLERIGDVFDKFDIDDSGMIDREELMQLGQVHSE